MNEVRYYSEFQGCFLDLLSHIEQANERVWLETYCLDRSQPARELIATLTKACLKGIQCVVCVDAIGSAGCLPKEDLSIFREAGGRLCLWNPLRPFHRNHRKLVVCDNTLYCMSGNFDSRSCSPSRGAEVVRGDGSTRALDINNALSIRGPVAMEGIQSVNRTIRKCRLPFARKRFPKIAPYVTVRQAPALRHGKIYTDIEARWLESEGAGAARSWLRPINSYRDALINSLEKAAHQIFIASAYFQPPRFLRKRLVAASERGTKVDLVISGRSDVPGDAMATKFTLKNHLFQKPFVWSTMGRHLHTKTLVVDKRLSVFGSYNWDRFSARRNREAGILIKDEEMACQVLKDFHKLPLEPVDLSKSSIFDRAKEWLCYHALRITARTTVRQALET